MVLRSLLTVSADISLLVWANRAPCLLWLLLLSVSTLIDMAEIRGMTVGLPVTRMHRSSAVGWLFLRLLELRHELMRKQLSFLPWAEVGILLTPGWADYGGRREAGPRGRSEEGICGSKAGRSHADGWRFGGENQPNLKRMDLPDSSREPFGGKDNHLPVGFGAWPLHRRMHTRQIK